MAEPMRNRETLTMRTKKIAAALVLAVLTLVVMAAPAPASQEITEFEVGSSDLRAGAHPDLVARLRLDKPGEPEVAKNVTVNLPEGIFGNPGAVFKCGA